MLKPWFRYIVISISVLLLNGCGYHLRRSYDLPTGFHQVYLQSSTPYSLSTSLLRNQLTALKVRLVDTKSKAHYIISLSNMRFEHDNPGITTSNQVITLNYRFFLTLQVLRANGSSAIGPVPLLASQEVILNANQLFTNNISPEVNRQLSYRMIDLIFDQLMSKIAKKALAK